MDFEIEERCWRLNVRVGGVKFFCVFYFLAKWKNKIMAEVEDNRLEERTRGARGLGMSGGEGGRIEGARGGGG